MQLNKGRQVKCVKKGGCRAITDGKVYTLQEDVYDSHTMLVVVDDEGDTGSYYVTRFEVVVTDAVLFNQVPEGTPVYCLLHGAGHIAPASKSQHYPVSVLFEDGTKNTYTAQGRTIRSHAQPTLFWHKPEFPNQEPTRIAPFEPTMIGKKVMVTDRASGEYLSSGEVENETAKFVEVRGIDYLKASRVFTLLGEEL